MLELHEVLLLGGTGFLGRHVCEALVRLHGGAANIVVPTRRLAHGHALLALPAVALEQADVHDDATLQRLVRGRAVVVNLVGVLHADAAGFQRVHADLPRRLAAACEVAGVRRLLHVSALGVADDAPSMYLRSKAAGEGAVRSGRVPWTVLRPSVMFGDGDHFATLFAGLLRHLPLLPLAAAEARLQPVWVDDVAQAIARAATHPGAAGQVYECAGPVAMTLREAVEAVNRCSGRQRRHVVALPAALAALQAALFEWAPSPLLSRDNLATLKVPSVASGRLPGLAALGITPTPLEAVLPSLLQPAATLRDRWRAAGRRL
jgi:NADH dehydrogenase